MRASRLGGRGALLIVIDGHANWAACCRAFDPLQDLTDRRHFRRRPSCVVIGASARPHARARSCATDASQRQLAVVPPRVLVQVQRRSSGRTLIVALCVTILGSGRWLRPSHRTACRATLGRFGAIPCLSCVPAMPSITRAKDSTGGRAHQAEQHELWRQVKVPLMLW